MQHVVAGDRRMQAIDDVGRFDAVATWRRKDARALRACAQFRRQHRFDLEQRCLRAR
jgi:hypothetical protein